MIILNKSFLDPEGEKLRILIAFYEEATVIGEDLGFDENDVGNR